MGTRRQLSRRGLLNVLRGQAPAPEAPPEPTPPWQQDRKPRGAAKHLGPPPGTPMLARVLAFNCIAKTGCSTCLDHCPIPGALSMTGTRVRVDPDLCDGCGACQPLCPAPEPAIDLLPRLPASPERTP